jgi:hypothetical protein
LISAGGSAAATVIFGAASAKGAGVSCAGCSDAGGADGGELFGTGSGLISTLACCANVSDVTGAISLDDRDAGASVGFSGAAGAVATGAAAFGAADTGAGAAADAAAAVAGAGGAPDACGDGATGFSGCWKATSIM